MSRLEEYLLIEVTSMSEHLLDLKKDIINWFKIIGKVFDKEGWNVNSKDMLNVLNAIVNSEGVEFISLKRKSSGKYISGAQFGGKSVDRGIFFTVWVNPDFADYFRRFSKPNRRKMFLDINQNAFARELYDVLAHETAHAMQAIAITDRGNQEKYVASTQQQDRENDPIGYYADPREVEAYALQAAIEYVRLNQSRIIDLYQYHFKENNPKIWKKFLKVYSFYKKQVKDTGIIAALAYYKNRSGRK